MSSRLPSVLLAACTTASPVLAPTVVLAAAADLATPGSVDRPRPQDTRHRIRSGGRFRYYNVHTPPGHDPGEPHPVVLVFHGGTGWGQQMAESSHFSEIADLHGFVAVYPEGWAVIPYLFQTWNAPLADDSGASCGEATRRGIDDVRFVRDLLDDLDTRLAVDPRRTFASGHSNGAMLCYRLAAELSDRIAAIAPNAGARHFPDMPPVPVPLMAMHGKLDRSVPWEGGPGEGICDIVFEGQAASIGPYLSHNGCSDPALEERRGDALHYVAPSPETGADVELWWLLDGGHSWPGGEPPGWNPREPQNHDIQGAEEAWLFFAEHPLPE